MHTGVERCIVLAILFFSAAGCGGDKGLPAPPASLQTDTLAAQAAPDIAPTATTPQAPAEMPIPSEADIIARFNDQVFPLVNQLTNATEDRAAVITAVDEIIYVPVNWQLLYIQSILRLTDPMTSNGGKYVYVLYYYSRGVDLVWPSPSNKTPELPIFKRVPEHGVTQAVNSFLSLVVEQAGRFTLVEQVAGTGGEGSTSYKQMVERSIQPFTKLSTEQSNQVVKDMQDLIGYACGIEMPGEYDANQRAAALSVALQSVNWSSQKMAAQFLGKMIPFPSNAVPILFGALEEVNLSSNLLEAMANYAETPPGFDLVLEAAASPQVTTRRQAAVILGRIPSKPEAAVAPLLKLFSDEDQAVKSSAVEALGKLGAPAAFSILVADLNSPDEVTRLNALEVLAGYNEKAASAIPQIVPFLQDATFQARRSAATVLGNTGAAGRSALPDLEQATRVETHRNAFRAEISAIQAISGQADALELLKTLFNPSQSTDVRYETCQIASDFGQKGDLGAVDILISCFADSDSIVHESAISGLNLMAFSGYKLLRAIPTLIKALEDPDDLTRMSAMDALAHIGPEARSAVPALIQAMSKPDYSSHCLEALKAISGVDLGNDTQAWTAWWEEN